ncbi:hypothetical protein ACF0H5_019460 [Mactra antiquata]
MKHTIFPSFLACLDDLLRKYLNFLYLTTTYKNTRKKARDELKQCRSKIVELDSERNQVREDIQQKDSAGNQLRAQHDRLSQEISDERQIEKLICDRLDKEEYELNKVEVERGKFLLAEDELIKKEDRLAKEKTDLAIKRLRKEEKKAYQAEKNMKNHQRYILTYLMEVV